MINWPGQRLRFVFGKGRLEFDGAGGGVNLVVNHGKCSRVQDRCIVAIQGQHRDRALGEFAGNDADILLREGEHDGNGTQLGDDHDAVAVGGVDDVALVHQAEAATAVQRGANGGVIQLHLATVNSRLVVFNHGVKLAHQVALRVRGLSGDDVGQVQIALPIQFGVVQLGLVLRLLGYGLVQSRPERGGVNQGQQVVAVNVLAFGEGDLDQLAVHPRFDRHGIEGLDGPQAVEINGNLFQRDFSWSDGNGEVPAFDRGGGGLGGLGFPNDEADAAGNEQEDDDPQKAPRLGGSRWAGRAGAECGSAGGELAGFCVTGGVAIGCIGEIFQMPLNGAKWLDFMALPLAVFSNSRITVCCCFDRERWLPNSSKVRDKELAGSHCTRPPAG